MMNEQRGITLIEMMIAMLVGLIITAGVMAMFISNVKSSSENVKMIRLNQQLRGALNFISDEVKRAGYSAAGDPVYMSFFDTVDQDGDGTDDCILYAYDENADGSAHAQSDNFGFKLQNNAIYWANNVTSCGGSDWQPITDTSIAFIPDNGFSVIHQHIPSSTVFIERLTVTLTGQIDLNPGTAERTITEVIRIRNDNAG